MSAIGSTNCCPTGSGSDDEKKGKTQHFVVEKRPEHNVAIYTKNKCKIL